MVRTRLMAALVVVLAAGLLAGCGLVNSVLGITEFPGGAGKLISVDKNGHVKTNMEYQQWGDQYMLNTEGTIEYDSFYNTTTSAPPVQNWGFKGTYTYDPKTFTLTVAEASEYDSTSKTWVADDPTQTTTDTLHMYFADHAFGRVYMQTSGGWQNVTVWQAWVDKKDSSKTGNYTRTQTLSIAGGKDGYKYTETGVSNEWDFTSPITDYKGNVTGDATLFPAGVKLEKNTQVSVHIKETVDNYQNWDYTNNTFGPVQNNTLQNDTNNYWIGDGYLIEYPSNLSRQAAPRA